MVRFVILCFICMQVAFIGNCYAQTPKSEWKNQPLDSLVNDLEKLLIKDLDSTLSIASEVIERARIEQNQFLEAKTRRIQISALWLLGNYTQALDSISNSQKLIDGWIAGVSGREKSKLEMIQIAISNEEGRLHSRMGNHQEAIQKYKGNIRKLETMEQTPEIKQKKAAFMANMAISYKIMGGQLDSVIMMYEKSRDIFKELNEPYYISRINLNLGIALQSKGNYQKALELYLEGYNIAKENDSHIQGNFLISMIALYVGLKDYESALNYAKIGLALVEKQKDLPLQAHMLLTVSSTYSNMEKLDSTIYYAEKSLTISEPLNDFLNQIDAYRILAKAHIELKSYQRAKEYTDKGFKVLEGHEDRFLELQLLTLKSQCLFKLNQLDSSKIYIQKAIGLLEKEGNNTHKKSVFGVAHEIYSALDKPDLAYRYLLDYTSYRDSVWAEEKTLEIARVEYDFKLKTTVAVKDAEMAQQEAEIKKQKYQTYLLIVGILLLIAAMGAMFQRLKVARIRTTLAEKQKQLDMSLLITDNKMRHKFNQQLEDKLEVIVSLDEADMKSELKSYLFDVKNQLEREERLDHLTENLEVIHSEFDKNLCEKFPELTQSEIEVCHLIRLNLSTKEIAERRNTTLGAIKTARYRIAIKLSIETKDLDGFIKNQL